MLESGDEIPDENAPTNDDGDRGQNEGWSCEGKFKMTSDKFAHRILTSRPPNSFKVIAPTRYFVYGIVSVLKLIAFFGSMWLIVSLNGILRGRVTRSIDFVTRSGGICMKNL